MASTNKLVWDKVGERFYSIGVEKTVLFPIQGSTYLPGEAWNGVQKFKESPSGAEATKMWANNGGYGQLVSAEEYAFTIDCYMTPKSFDACLGEVSVNGVRIGQQDHKPFGLVTKVGMGNDTEGMRAAYELIFAYSAVAKPAENEHGTINADPEAATLSYESSCSTIPVEGYGNSASVKIRSTEVSPEALAVIEAAIYGCDADDVEKLPESAKSQFGSGMKSTMLMPEDLFKIMAAFPKAAA